MAFTLKLDNLKSVPKFIKYVWDINPKVMLTNILLRVGQTIVPLILLYIIKILVDLVVLYAKSGPREDYLPIISLILLELGLAVLSNLLARGIEFTDAIISDIIVHQTSVDIMKKSSELDLEQFQDAEFQDKLNRARTQMQVREYLMGDIMFFIQGVVTLIIISGALISFNFWYIIVLVISIIPSSLGDSYLNKLYFRLNILQTSKRRELDYVCYLGASSETAKEIKIYTLYNYFLNRFQFVSKKLFLSKREVHILRLKLSSIYFSASTLGYYSIYGAILLDAAKGNITVGDLSLISGLFFRVRDSLESLSKSYIRIAQSALQLQNLFDFYEIEYSLPNAIDPKPFPDEIKVGFEFKNVGFKYQNTEKWVLKNMNLKFEMGSRVALVGENGSGKSTIIKLLTRLYDPSEGQILLDNIDIKEYDKDEYRRGVTVLFQDFMRYNMPVNRNIGFGNLSKLNDMARINKAADLGLASDVIEQFPKKYNQMLGKMFEDGMDLSGGQWQKIALARAYMRDSQIYILDEPTSALDAQSEDDIINIFNEHVKNKISVIISHKFSIIRKADVIIIIEKGVVKEVGNHEQLIHHDSIYAQLYNLQARGYLLEEEPSIDEFEEFEELVS
jgi:ATP-binding cassette, subfamily B, bacterial